MVWVRFRFADKTVSPCWSPLGTAKSFTITKKGVLFFREDDSFLQFYPAERVAEVQDSEERLIGEEITRGDITYRRWTPAEVIPWFDNMPPKVPKLPAKEVLGSAD